MAQQQKTKVGNKHKGHRSSWNKVSGKYARQRLRSEKNAAVAERRRERRAMKNLERKEAGYVSACFVARRNRRRLRRKLPIIQPK